MGPESPTSTPYRNDKTILASRLEKLHDELAVIRETRHEIEALAQRESEVLSEITRLKEELAKFRAKQRLPLLDLAYVASPCKADWKDMVGDERTRFCQLCKKDVHNLSAMSFDEAETFLRELTGDACVRMYRRKDGTVMTNDCPVGVRNKRVKGVAAALVGTGMAAVGASSMAQTGALDQVQGGLAEVHTLSPEMAVQGGMSEADLREEMPVPMGTVAVPQLPVEQTPTKPRLLTGPSTVANSKDAKGTLVANCTIAVSGRARDCKIVSGPAVMHQPMRDMISQQVYQPARHHGQSIEAPYTIRVNLDEPPKRTGLAGAALLEAPSVGAAKTTSRENAANSSINSPATEK